MDELPATTPGTQPTSDATQQPAVSTQSGEAQAGQGGQQGEIPPAIREFVEEAVGRAFRAAQSSSDKGRAQLERRVAEEVARVQAAIAALESSTGKQIPASERQRMIAEASERAATAPAEDHQAAEPPPEVRAMLAAATAMEKAMGVSLEEGDPELGMINQDPAQFLDSVAAALRAKANRLSGTNPQRRDARLPSGPAAPASPSAGMSAEDLISEGLKRAFRK